MLSLILFPILLPLLLLSLLLLPLLLSLLLPLFSQRGADNEDHIRVGKLNLVDLAGSERQTKTGSVVRLSH